VIRGKTLNHFPSVIDHLLTIFEPSEVGVIAAGFLDVVPVSGLTNQISNDKLALVQHICKGPIFKDSGARQSVLKAILDTLEDFMNPSEETEKKAMPKKLQSILGVDSTKKSFDEVCVQIMLSMLQVVQEDDDKLCVEKMTKLLPFLVNYVNKRLQRIDVSAAGEDGDIFNEHLSNGATCLFSLLYLMDQDQYKEYVQGNAGEMLLEMITCLYTMLNVRAVYPSVWLVFHVFQSEVTTKILEWTNRYMLEEMSGNAEEDIALAMSNSLWRMVYETGLAIITSDVLEAEGSNANKISLLINNAYKCDLRVCVCGILTANWVELSDQAKMMLAHNVVQRLLAQVGSGCEEVKQMGADFYFDLIKSEYVLKKDFEVVRDHTISSVGAIVSGDMAKEGESNGLYLLFKEGLAAKFEADDVLNCPDGKKYITEIQQLFALLLALAKFPKNAVHEQERSFAYAHLMEFLLKMNRIDSYTRYAHALSGEMLSLGLNIEAGKALLMHANLLKFDGGDKLAPFVVEGEVPLYGEETSMRRKERLYKDAMKLFDKAQYWEGSLKLSSELKEFYGCKLYDYEKCSNVLVTMSKYYEMIKRTDRFYPSTFRVGYYGDFGPEFKNMEFVYRGDVLESIGDFTTRIKMKFPTATMLGVKIDAGEEHKGSTSEQYIQISKVGCESGFAGEVGKGEGWMLEVVPRYARDFEENNEVEIFSYSRPFNKRKLAGLGKSANEFLDLWIEKKYLKTEVILPSVQRRAKVVEMRIELINPLENAVTEVDKKNQELREKFGLMEKLEDGGADNSYTMALNGVVDAAVNGGTGNYETFINGKYRDINPEIYEDVSSTPEKKRIAADLVRVLKDQLEILEWGVQVHGSKCSEQLKPLHEHITMMFAKMKKSMIEMIDSAVEVV